MITKGPVREKNCAPTEGRIGFAPDRAPVWRDIMETNKLKKMMKKVEDAMAATSFAEEGERAAAQSLMNEGRRVLLALKEGKIDVKTLKYAVNTSKRIGAQLDILYVSAAGHADGVDDPLVKDLQSELSAEGIPYRLIRRTGCLKQAVIDHTNKDKEILFAVVESPNSLDTDCNNKDTRLSELWQQLKCPLVVVMDGARA